MTPLGVLIRMCFFHLNLESGVPDDKLSWGGSEGASWMDLLMLQGGSPAPCVTPPTWAVSRMPFVHCLDLFPFRELETPAATSPAWLVISACGLATGILGAASSHADSRGAVVTSAAVEPKSCSVRLQITRFSGSSLQSQIGQRQRRWNTMRADVLK
mmetsp:Transcript_33586/g.55298  ORF Transcript_33586/g.55298 Transcript_33586/m.55298 type:complete len:157 (-) Transcript_33586:462-932(-)